MASFSITKFENNGTLTKNAGGWKVTINYTTAHVQWKDISIQIFQYGSTIFNYPEITNKFASFSYIEQGNNYPKWYIFGNDSKNIRYINNESKILKIDDNIGQNQFISIEGAQIAVFDTTGDNLSHGDIIYIFKSNNADMIPDIPLNCSIVFVALNKVVMGEASLS